jgi:ribosome-binding protein aMBF1 (putative translation factor)
MSFRRRSNPRDPALGVDRDPHLVCGASEDQSARLFDKEQVKQAHGTVLKTLREDTAGLSQEQLAEETETDRTYVSLQEH